MDCNGFSFEEKNSPPDELAESFTHFVLTFYYRMQEHPVNLCGIKLSSHAFHVLYILKEDPRGQVPMTELVTRIRRTKQQLSKLTSDLEDDGLVARVRMKENRRAVYVTLTDKGNEFVRQATASMVGAMTQFLRSLPEEKRTVIEDVTNQLTVLINEEV